MKQHLLAALAATLVAAPALAGINYQATTTMETAQGDQVIAVDGWVEGNSAKIVFTASDNPMFAAGSYLLTTDGGETLVYVDPDEKTYSPFDLDEVAGMAGAMMQGMGGMMKMSFSNHEIEKLAEEAGPQMLGHATTHYRFRSSYDSEIRIMGMGQESSNETVTDTWTTTELSDAGFAAWLRREPPKTGIAELDAMLAAEMSQGIRGVPLKVTSTTTSRDKKRGQTTTSGMTLEVTALREAAVPAGAFQMPSGYEKVELMEMYMQR
jgi:hypothetical protein